jgi:molybdopterin-guanine dinucleotide biosynthesis protein A/molybdopterin converting factor small subunit
MKEQPTIADATAVILTGGKSSRMGRPKALLPFAGEPLIAHVVRNLKQIFAEAVVVAAPDQELPGLPAILVRDEIAYQGPVSGIYHGLMASTKEVCFVTSCDAPFLNLQLIANLLSQISDYDVVVPYWQERFQPLHAVYRRSVAPLCREQLARGELRPISLYPKVKTREVHEDEIRHLDPEGLSFLNMNSPEDYQHALARWDNSQRLETEAEGNRARMAMEDSATLSSDIVSFPNSISVSVELFGVARLLAKTQTVPLILVEGATLAHAYAALAEKLPALNGRVVGQAGLMSGYSCNINGLEFVRASDTKINPGDKLLILSADAGG